MNAANILKPALSRGEVQVIGATTFEEYRKYIEKDAALERRFQPVTVKEPTVEDTIEVLNGIKSIMNSTTVCTFQMQWYGCVQDWQNGISQTVSCRIKRLT